jgi:hypothetical protein
MSGVSHVAPPVLHNYVRRGNSNGYARDGQNRVLGGPRIDHGQAISFTKDQIYERNNDWMIW